MSSFILDLFFALTFVILLSLLARIRGRTFNGNRDSYHCTIGGLFSLGVVSVIQLMSHQGLFEYIPLLSEPIYLEVVEIIGIVAGIMLLLAGVSIWIPGRRERQEKASVEKREHIVVEDIISKIMQADNSVVLFDDIPRLIADRFGFDSLAVLRRYHQNRRILLTNVSNLSFSTRDDIISLLRTSSAMPRVIKEIHNDVAPVAEIPLMIGERKVGAVIFWKDQPETLCEDELNALGGVAEVYASVLAARYTNVKSEFFEGSWRHFVQVQDILADRKDLKGKLQSFYHLFRQAVGAEYLSLGLIESGRENVKRYTIGVNASVLLDGVANPGGASSCFTRVVESGQSIRLGDVQSRNRDEVDSLLLSCGQHSLMAVPVLSAGNVIAVLTLGHRSRRHFTRRDLLRAEMLVQAMTPAVTAELSRRTLLARDRRLGALVAFNTAVESCCDVNTLLEAAAETILKGVGTSLVRVTTYDQVGGQLETRAMKTVRPFDRVRTEAVAVSKLMTRWHGLVLEQQRPLLINQRDPETTMDKPEMDSLVMPGMQSALIIPIVINGLVFGLVTLGEMRCWERFSYDSVAITFCREVIARLVSGLKLMNMSRIISSSKVDREPMAVVRPESDRFRDLKSPVTSLRGSLDLLKIRGLRDEVYADELVHSMERSTDRIMSLLHES